MVSRMAEYKALHEQFPVIEGRDGRLDFINYDFDESVKDRLLSSLSELKRGSRHTPSPRLQ